VPHHAPMHQQIVPITLTAFNQYGNALTVDQLTTRLFVPSNNRSPNLRTRQRPLPFNHRSLTDELQDLLATYRKLFTAPVQITAGSMLLDPFRQVRPSLLLDTLLFGIARCAP
jgi:hypothetical protein